MTKKRIVITSLPEDHVPVLKVIRTIGYMEFRKAKEIYTYVENNIPCVIVAGIDEDKADNLAEKFLSVGGGVKVCECNLEHPTVLRPEVNKIFEWHWLFGLRETKL